MERHCCERDSHFSGPCNGRELLLASAQFCSKVVVEAGSSDGELPPTPAEPRLSLFALPQPNAHALPASFAAEQQ